MKLDKFHVEVLQASPADVDEVESFLYPGYFNESGYSHLDYDANNCKAMISSWIKDGIGLIIRANGIIVAFASISFMRTFYKQVEADIDMFFVLPEYRGTGVARMLSNALSEIAKEGNAEVVYSSCLSELGEKNNQLYINLWKKLGFRELGTVMVRS